MKGACLKLRQRYCGRLQPHQSERQATERSSCSSAVDYTAACTMTHQRKDSGCWWQQPVAS